MTDPIKKIISEIAAKLSENGGVHVSASRRRVKYRTLPFNTDAMFAGVPLRNVLNPPMLPAAINRIEEIFNMWVESMVDSAVLSAYDGLDSVPFGTAVEHFMRAQPAKITREERLVRLLYFLGATPGATILAGDGKLFVTGGREPFGIESDGSLLCNYSLQLDPQAVRAAMLKLNTVQECISADQNFAAAMFAIRKLAGKKRLFQSPMELALIALMHCDDRVNYKMLVDKVRPVQKLSNEALISVEKLIMGDPDPLMAMYEYLVPHYIPRGIFMKTFGILRGRKTHLGLRKRAKLVEKLGLFLWELNSQFDYGEEEE